MKQETRYTYTGLVRKDGESGFWARFPDFDDCTITARSFNRLMEKASDALQDRIDWLSEQGQQIPVPRISADHQLNPSLGTQFAHAGMIHISAVIPQVAPASSPQPIGLQGPA